MSLPKKTISNYEIVSKIGEGGMGEVYRARDKDLSRDVAIKVLPAAFSTDEERLRRFQQEAQAVGALNHPNILVIYHIGTDDGAPYIVSELLEGETLREKIAGSPLPTRKAIDYALQIAHGLAAAHEKRIIHRDLKPENIFVTRDGRVKILDFGLAKLTQPETDQTQTDIPTRRVDTDPGTIMGTIAYMSPEQVRAKPLDHRTDIFSFGVILYEMLSGKQAFHGESTADMMSAILREDPPRLSATNSTVAPALERVIDHCLEKNPEERFHSASDLAFAIEALSGTTSISASSVIPDLPAPRRRYGNLIPWVAVGILLLVSAALALLYLRVPASDTRPISFVIEMPDKAVEVASPIISPDGRTIAFLGSVEGKRFLYIRSLDSTTDQRLPGTDDATFPFWSHDSKYIGFFSSNKLKKVDLSGGSPQTLCDAPQGTGGAWNREGVILFGMGNKALSRVSASGGEPASVLSLDTERKEIEQDFPLFLPDGRHFLYYSWNGNASATVIFAASLDGSERKALIKNDSNVAYVSPGYILFARDSTLMAQPFDSSSLTISGDPFPVMENVTYTGSYSYSNFSVSDNGTLVYWKGNLSERQLMWFDRDGKQIASAGPNGNYFDVVISPDDKRAAIQKSDGNASDIWIMDLTRGMPVRFTFDAATDDNPSWASDGNTVIYTSVTETKTAFYRKASNGSGDAELLGEVPISIDNGTDVSQDGNNLFFEMVGEKTGVDIWILPLTGDKKPYPLLQTQFDEYMPHFSPDGHWFAYCSRQSGTSEVYVQTFPLGGGLWQVSSGGGGQPHWRHDGKELFYISPDRKLMAVDVKLGPKFEMGTPVPLFQTQVSGFMSPNRYAVSSDGQRFLINSALQESTKAPLTVVLNWTANIKR